MHINNQKYFMVRNSQNIFMEHDLNIIMILGIKIYNFDPYDVFLAIATIYPATYDWFYGPESRMSFESRCTSLLICSSAAGV